MWSVVTRLIWWLKDDSTEPWMRMCSSIASVDAIVLTGGLQMLMMVIAAAKQRAQSAQLF